MALDDWEHQNIDLPKILLARGAQSVSIDGVVKSDGVVVNKVTTGVGVSTDFDDIKNEKKPGNNKKLDTEQQY